ncbi:trehalose-6-phosphate hydrolase [Aeromonas sobria]|uniref:Trehalose-6-phosphate hydrolase n=1 Tax=Aeromonas sobria TaxID=646 RepID=A0A2N3J5Q9_AERSO|nr:alpha-glucosidase [Aeromonas sobria]PKQ81699.1 trehalose-6-phosphate hydrolase [Aeromonas sobria]
MKTERNSVIYQIYPRSFQDSNGDGIGDLNGIRSRLGYLSQLGVDMLWLTPVYASPQRDNGYDISNYHDIDPAFGSFSDMLALISEAATLGIGIMMDIVANHTSTEHSWFKKALAGDKSYQDFYVFRDQQFVNEYPLTSIFGGNAWEYVPALDMYYLHNFDITQADLDWDNVNVRKAMAAVVQFWLDQGIKGFRFDVIDMISKNWPTRSMSNGPRLHDYIKELNHSTFGGKNIITVGETWSADLEHMKSYSSPAGDEFSMVFNFEHLGFGHDKWQSHINIKTIKNVFTRNQCELRNQGWNSLFLSNHDLPRAVSRFGNDTPQWRELSAKQWAIILHMQQGTPFIYQGEELGMTNRQWHPSEIRDIEAKNYFNSHINDSTESEVLTRIRKISRDNARTPMQWDDTNHASFSTVTPWIQVNENYHSINVANQQHDDNSVFNCYRKLISLRKKLDIIREGDFTMLGSDTSNHICYSRQWQGKTLIVMANLTTTPLAIPVHKDDLATLEPLLTNYPTPSYSDELRPLEAVVWLTTK